MKNAARALFLTLTILNLVLNQYIFFGGSPVTTVFLLAGLIYGLTLQRLDGFLVLMIFYNVFYIFKGFILFWFIKELESDNAYLGYFSDEVLADSLDLAAGTLLPVIIFLIFRNFLSPKPLRLKVFTQTVVPSVFLSALFIFVIVAYQGLRHSIGFQIAGVPNNSLEGFGPILVAFNMLVYTGLFYTFYGFVVSKNAVFKYIFAACFGLNAFGELYAGWKGPLIILSIVFIYVYYFRLNGGKGFTLKPILIMAAAFQISFSVGLFFRAQNFETKRGIQMVAEQDKGKSSMLEGMINRFTGVEALFAIVSNREKIGTPFTIPLRDVPYYYTSQLMGHTGYGHSYSPGFVSENLLYFGDMGYGLVSVIIISCLSLFSLFWPRSLFMETCFTYALLMTVYMLATGGYHEFLIRVPFIFVFGTGIYIISNKRTLVKS
jgi:hypothetical protein